MFILSMEKNKEITISITIKKGKQQLYSSTLTGTFPYLKFEMLYTVTQSMQNLSILSNLSLASLFSPTRVGKSISSNDKRINQLRCCRCQLYTLQLLSKLQQLIFTETKKNNFHLQCSNILLPPQISNYIYNEHFQKLSSEEVQEGKKSAFSSKNQGISVLGMESTSQVLLSRAKLQLLIQPGLCSHHN